MRSWAQTALALLAPSLPLALGQHIRDLSGDGWSLSAPLLDRTVPARTPSYAHLDLLRSGVIDDPLHGLNNFDQRWVADSNWTYTSPPIQGLLKDPESSWLVFDGLDTFTTIELCGQFIANTDNQFRQYTFDISDVLRQCQSDPVLSINFGSAPQIANAIADEPGAPEWPEGVQQLYVFPNRWFIRKEQSDFGWDWGPAFAPAGPWRPAYVVQHERKESVYVLNTDLDIHRKDQINHLPPDQSKPWVVNASIDYLGSMPQNPSMSIRIKDADTGEVLTSKSPDNVRVSGDSVTGHIIVDSNTPKLWWPTGMGNQNLYDVEITVSGSDKKTLANVTKRSGFRTIYLNRQNITDEQIAQGIAPGANWHFEVNGHEFYAKGSNIIPPDVFWPRVTEQRMTELFNAVIAGNQNMLRVWSSGTYFPDYIYDLADKMGILLWSEFQFSCALYPVNEEFLENVAGEVTYNVRRVNHHPSLALWAGGNEFENLQLPIAERNAPPEEYYRLVGAYEKLHITLIMPLVYENSRSISYMPTSTNNGYLGIDLWGPVPMIERYHNVTEGHYYGDTDYYNYNTTESFDYTTYPVNRFANEFGFHSMPSLQTWRQAIEPSEFEFNSSVVMLRNHHQPPGSRDTRNFEPSATGMGEMTLGVQKYYPTPFKSDSVANFSSWCHATQLFQADFYQSQIQYYRRGSGMPERQLGSLYWQLEDIWQAPSWAGIEYGGRWKVLHYKMRDIYWPVIVSPFWNYTTGDVEVYVTSDLWESVSGTAKLQWLDLSGNPIPDNAGTPSSTKFEVGALNTTAIYTTNVSKLSLKDPKNAILLLSIEADGHRPNSDETTTFTHENYFHPVFPKDLALVDPEIELSFDSATGKYTVEAKSGVAIYTWLDFPGGVGGHFEDNAFVLVPGQKREIGFVEDNGTGGDWVGDVTVSSLWDLTRD